MKALVTGATGFVGSHIVECLVGEGMDVACLVRPTSDLTFLRTLPVEIIPGRLDDPADAARAAKGADYIFHVAGVTKARSLEEYLAANVSVTEAFLEAVVRLPEPPRRFVYISSLAAVGPNPRPVPLDESAEPRPHDNYGLSKLRGEQAVLRMARRLPVTVVRPPAVYGPRDTNMLPLFRFCQRWGMAPILGSGNNEMTLAEVTDLARGTWLAARSDAAIGQVYFIASSTSTLAELADAMAFALGRRLRTIRVPAPVARLIGELGELKWTLTGKPQIISRRKVRDALQPRWTCSWAKAERELGYKPAFDLPRGLRRTAEWYAQQGWIKPLPSAGYAARA